MASILLSSATCLRRLANAGDVVFPGAEWQAKAPQELGLDDARLEAIAQALGSRGCAMTEQRSRGRVFRTPTAALVQ